jgi:hypothetical protein
VLLSGIAAFLILFAVAGTWLIPPLFPASWAWISSIALAAAGVAALALVSATGVRKI